MHKVQLSYQLSAERSPNALVRNPLLDLLHAVREHGSISGAARHLGLSTAMSGAHSKMLSNRWATR